MARPTAGWLLVEKIETEDKIGHIFITELSRERIAGWTYSVVSNGGPLPSEDEEDEPLTPYDFQPGDWILAPPRRAIEADEEDLMLLAYDQVWAVLTA